MREAAVEAALRSDPDDRALWHTYSHWLTGQGDSRGGLIRLEQRLQGLRPAERPAVEHEIADLVADGEADWDAELPPSVRVRRRRHGFATAVAVTWSEDLRDVVEQVLRSRFVTALHILPEPPDDDYEEDEADWENDVWDGGPGPAGDPGRVDLGPLAGLDARQLVELDLAYIDLGPDGTEALATTVDLSGLRALDLRYCRVGDAGLAALAASPHLTGLHRLCLQRDRLTAAGVPSLHRFARLTELDLRFNEIGAQGAQALVDAPFAPTLTRLWLYHIDVGPDGARRLAEATTLPAGLRSLWRCV